MILGISGDSPFCHTAFRNHMLFPFPLLSDVQRSVVATTTACTTSTATWPTAPRSWWTATESCAEPKGDRQMVRDGSEVLRVLDLINSLRQQSS